MTMPIDLALVRHGQSEGNAAKRLSEKGDHSSFTEEFMNRHSSGFRLTQLGREQAKLVGNWLREEFYQNGDGFGRYMTSEYFRAIETAGLLNLPGAQWFCDFYLTERDWGEMDICPENEREKKFESALKRRRVEPFFWRPPNGESFAQLCLRVDRVLHTLHRECSDKKVIIVCHGEVMRAFQIRIERMTQERFRKLHFSQRSEDRIYNCEVIHYTRNNPYDDKIARSQYMSWVRSIRPTVDPIWTTGWHNISRPRYSNNDLLNIIEGYKITE